MNGQFRRSASIASITAITTLTLLMSPLAHGGESVASSGAPQTLSGVTKLVINIPSRTLWVYSGDRIVQYFPVGVGRPGFMTPLGRFSVIRKIEAPGWENPYRAQGQVRIAPGENNPLGTRWIGFYQKGGGEYGMHGTDNPGSVGKFSSHGCVRMKIADAEALFEMVDVGTPVEVVYETVLVRRNGQDVRLQVFPDRFHLGMPSVDEVKTKILQAHPNASIDLAKIKAALATPQERPVVVGVILPPVSPVGFQETFTERQPGKSLETGTSAQNIRIPSRDVPQEASR